MSKLAQIRPRVSWPLAIIAAVVTWLSAATLIRANDGAVLVDSKEYKLLLHVDRFADPMQGVNEFWAGVRRVADDLQLPVSGSVKDPERRITRYLDTEGFDLREKYGYVFRERVELKANGAQKKKKKVTLKFRAADVGLAKSKNVSSTAGDADDREEKLEEDIVPPRTSKFSHSGETKVKTSVVYSKVTDITNAFPGLAALPAQDEEIVVVRGFQAHEIKIDVGKIRLSDQHRAEASFTFWYDQPIGGQLLVAEFSYTYEVDPTDADARMAAGERADQLFSQMQSQLDEWLDHSAKTKTAIAYAFEDVVPQR